jgi:hypothetical protein
MPSWSRAAPSTGSSPAPTVMPLFRRGDWSSGHPLFPAAGAVAWEALGGSALEDASTSLDLLSGTRNQYKVITTIYCRSRTIDFEGHQQRWEVLVSWLPCWPIHLFSESRMLGPR